MCENSSITYHHFVMAITHVDGIFGRHHVPQSVTAKDDVVMPLGVKFHHGGIRLRRNYKLPAIEIITPQITCKQIYLLY